MVNITITVGRTPRIWEFGQKVYFLEMKKIQQFHASCPICDNTKKITYKGHELRCPNCEDKNMPSIEVYRPTLREFIVNKIVVAGPDYKNAWTKKAQTENINAPGIREVWAFDRQNAGYSGVFSRRVPDGVFVDPTLEWAADRSVDACCYTSPKAAKEVIELFTERERLRLVQFNEAYETNFEYPEEAKK